MNLFRQTKTLSFGEREVTVKEIGLEFFSLENIDNNTILEKYTDLSKEEVEKLSIKAVNKILDTFNLLNKEHFEQKEEVKEEGK